MVEFLNIAITVLIFILSALPLYFAVKLLGGKSSLIKATLVTVISGILVSAIQAAFGTEHPNADAAVEYADAWVVVEIGTHQLKRETTVAGDPEALNREIRLQDGIPIPRSLADKIRAICRRCGIPFVLE